MDRKYDDNKIFPILDYLKPDYVIRLKSNRELNFYIILAMTFLAQ